MTTNEYVQFVLEVKQETTSPQVVEETAVYEAAQLISGSFTYSLYEALWTNHFKMDIITQHLESLYDRGDHFGLVYFVFILANAMDFIIPAQFTEMSANDALIPILSAAIIEDWLEYENTYETTEYED